MDDLSAIIKKRSPPGIMIFDLHDRLLYSNRQALEMLAVRQEDEEGGVCVPGPIYNLCQQLKVARKAPAPSPLADLHCSILASGDCPPCSLRAFLIGDQGGGGFPSHIMVLLERIVERHEVDIDKARGEFQLTRREAEVVRLICLGGSNREISETMFISEYTVKDHLKSIMKKMGAGSRNEIIALLR